MVNILLQEGWLKVYQVVVTHLFRAAESLNKLFQRQLDNNSVLMMIECLRGGNTNLNPNLIERTMRQVLEQVQYNTFSLTASANYSSTSTSVPCSFIEILKNSTIIIGHTELGQKDVSCTRNEKS